MSRSTRRRRLRPCEERGLALVELAFVLPLLLLLTIGLIEYGWMFLKSQEVAGVARRGARIGVRDGATSSDVQTAVATMMQTVGMDSTGYSIAISPADLTDLAPGELVNVEVSVPYSAVGLTKFPLPMPGALVGSVGMVREGEPVD